MARTRIPDDTAGEVESGGEAAPAGGRGTPSDRRYPAVPAGSVLAKVAARAPAGKPATVDDVATVAVESRGSGSPVPGGVRGPVEAQLGVDLSGVRVHEDDGSRQASAAMGARAFAHGADVFLGPGESAGDLGLMAHELTHVAQQGAAQEKVAQRQVTVGAADSPAERQADAVAGQVTAGAAPTQLIIDAGDVQTGQMLKGPFMTQLRTQVTQATSDELGPVWSVAGCPYIDSVFGRYQNSDARTVEAMARRYSRVAAPRTAAEMIPPIVARVRDGVRRWKAGEDVSADLQAAGYTGTVPRAPTLANTASAAVDAVGDALSSAGNAVSNAFGSAVDSLGALLKPVDPSAPPTPHRLVTELGPGQPLDPGTAARMGDAFGEDFSRVRVHTGPEAARKASAEGAAAFAVGQDVVFNEGQYRPGTPVGDAMLAHELAHTVQQRGAGGEAMRQPIGPESAGAERDADQATAGVMTRLYSRGGTALRSVGERVGPALTTGYQLQRCGSGMATAAQHMPGSAENGRFENHRVARYRTYTYAIFPTQTDHWLTAMDTIGFHDREAPAIAMARASGYGGGAVTLENGRYVAYGVDPAVPAEGLFERNEMHQAQLRCEPGVVALISQTGFVLRPENYLPTAGPRDEPTPEGQQTVTASGEARSPADPFQAYRDGFGGASGDLNTLDRDRLMHVFEAAMRDNAVMVLARSEEEVRSKQRLYGDGGAGLSDGEVGTIHTTAAELAAITRQISEAEARAAPLHTPAVPGGPITILPPALAPESGAGTIDYALEGSREADRLRQQKRFIVARYPVLARIESADELDRLSRMPRAELAQALGGHLPGILTSIETTRRNLAGGSLNLWQITPLVESTMAGLGLNNQERRNWIVAEKDARGHREAVEAGILAAFQIGFGIASAVLGAGPLGLAFAAGAFGLSTYDALRQTQQYFVDHAAADTHLNPDDSLLPPEMARSWGWLVVAWGGALMDATALAGAAKATLIGNSVARLARGEASMERITQELAEQAERRPGFVQRLVERLRRAAGALNPAETISEANRAATASRLGTSLEIDASMADNAIEIGYTADRATGRVTVTGARCGARATIGDIMAHADIVRLLRRYEGVTGRLRELYDQFMSIAGIETTGTRLLELRPGSRGYESFLEIQKYRELIASRVSRLRAGGLTAADEARLRADVEFFETEADLHQRMMREMAAEAGSGFVAEAGQGTRAAIGQGYRLPGMPEITAAEQVTDDVVRRADYYYRQEGTRFILQRKVGRAVPPQRAVLVNGECQFQAADDMLTRSERAAQMVSGWGEPGAGAFDRLRGTLAEGERLVPVESLATTGQPLRAVIRNADEVRGEFIAIMTEANVERGMAQDAAAAAASQAWTDLLNHELTVVRGTDQLRAFGYRAHFMAQPGAATLQGGEELHHLIPLYIGGNHTPANLAPLSAGLHDRMHALVDRILIGDGVSLAPSSIQRAALNFERGAAILHADGTIEFLPLSEVVRRAPRAP